MFNPLQSFRKNLAQKSEPQRLRLALGALFVWLVLLSGAGVWALRQASPQGDLSGLAGTLYSVVSTLAIASGALLWWWGGQAAPARTAQAVTRPMPARAADPVPPAEEDPSDERPERYRDAQADAVRTAEPSPASTQGTAHWTTRPLDVAPLRTGLTTAPQGAPADSQALLHSAVNAAQRGGEVVVQVVQNLEDISASSRRINEIVATIDSIAFQTNILALNAAVQAARARQEGGGRASVAAEVRNLAQRAASAAKEIRALVNQSVDKVESGNRLVRDAGATMEAIVSSVQSVTDIIGRIGSADAQAATPGEVTGSVDQLDRLAGQHSVLIEQSASAADALRQQADRLQKVVSAFRLLQQTQEAAWTAHNAITGARSSSRFGALSDHRGRQGSDDGRDPSMPGDWEKF